MRIPTQNASQSHFPCFLKDIWIRQSTAAWKVPPMLAHYAPINFIIIFFNYCYWSPSYLATFAPVQNAAAEALQISLQTISSAPAWRSAPPVSSIQTSLPSVVPAQEWWRFLPVLTVPFLLMPALAAAGWFRWGPWRQGWVCPRHTKQSPGRRN